MSVALNDHPGNPADAGAMEKDALTESHVEGGRSSIQKPKDVVDATEAYEEDLTDIDYASASTYNIYHRKDNKEHYIITPFKSPYHERSKPDPKLQPVSIFTRDDIPEGVAENTFFVHKPIIGFHHPPRTLRRGTRKNGEVVCLINNSSFWRKWNVQFGDQLSAEGVIDPRGVISADCPIENPAKKELQVKSYGVRTWRMWGDTGKKYHQEYNEQRKNGTQKPVTSEKPRKDLITEAVYFSWHSPFSRQTRHYRFDYAGLEFYWKGTGTVKETGKCGWWMRYHHLKLCVRVPVLVTASSSNDEGPIKRTTTWGGGLTRFGSKPAGFREVCLGKYTSSVFEKKAGELHLYDDAMYRLLLDGVIPLDAEKKQELERTGAVGVKKLRLYEIIIATAMCMVIGEWQKRMAIIAILSAAGEGGG